MSPITVISFLYYYYYLFISGIRLISNQDEFYECMSNSFRNAVELYISEIFASHDNTRKANIRAMNVIQTREPSVSVA
jgi:C4-dicarboxylate transporter